jgi:hypothetical protein
MAPATATQPPKLETHRRARPGRWGRIALIAAVVVLVLLAIAVALCRRPFSEGAILQDLHEISDSQVTARAFHQKLFPYPGCVLEGVVFRHGSHQIKPLITIERLTIQGSYLGLLQTRVRRITAEGMRIFVPAFGTGEDFHTTPSTISVDEIVANGSSVEFAFHDPDKTSLRFDIHEALMRDVVPNRPFSYRLKVHNPEPPGEVAVEGKFGPWKRGDAGETPISGEYTFEHADLSVYHGVAGILSSKGKFEGNLAHIDIDGKNDVPDFEVKMGGHPVRLTTEFSAYVDAMHGDTYLKQVTADFWKTHVVGEGSIAKSASGKGKTALINFRSNNARIDDLLRLFVKASRPPMSGKVTLQARVEIPPGHEEFLKKIKLRGSFGIDSGVFTKPKTQEGVNKLSAGALGEKDPVDPETVLMDLTGQVDVLGGVSRFSDLSFNVPGAAARMHGTYNLLNHKIDLRGQLQVDSKISNTESGTKAFLLKMMEPFFKKKKKGEIVPVRISGTYEHPTFGLDLNDKKAQKVAEPRTSKHNR